MQPPPSPVWCRTTEPRRSYCSTLWMPREPVLSTWGPELVTTDSFSVAFTAIGGVADDELLSNEEKKRITEARPKSRSLVVRGCRSQPGPPGAPPENPPVSSQEFLLSQTNSTYQFQSVWPLDWCGRQWRYRERRLISKQRWFYISFVRHAPYS